MKQRGNSSLCGVLFASRGVQSCGTFRVDTGGPPLRGLRCGNGCGERIPNFGLFRRHVGADCVAGFQAGGHGFFCQIREVGAIKGAGLLVLQAFVGIAKEGLDFAALIGAELQRIEALLEEEGLGCQQVQLILNDFDLVGECGVLRMAHEPVQLPGF